MCKVVFVSLLLFLQNANATEKFSLIYDYRSLTNSSLSSSEASAGRFHSQTLGYLVEDRIPGVAISASLTTQQPDYDPVLNSVGQFEKVPTNDMSEYISD